MQYPFRALTRNFNLIRLRKLRGHWPAGPAGNSEIRVVSAKCSMSLNDHLLRPGGTRPPCFAFTRFTVKQCLFKKNKYVIPAHCWKTTRSLHSAKYCRYQTYSDALKNSFKISPELLHIGIVCLLLWPIPKPQKSLGHSSFSHKHSWIKGFNLYRRVWKGKYLLNTFFRDQTLIEEIKWCWDTWYSELPYWQSFKQYCSDQWHFV